MKNKKALKEVLTNQESLRKEKNNLKARISYINGKEVREVWKALGVDYRCPIDSLKTYLPSVVAKARELLDDSLKSNMMTILVQNNQSYYIDYFKDKIGVSVSFWQYSEAENAVICYFQNEDAVNEFINEYSDKIKKIANNCKIISEENVLDEQNLIIYFK